MTSFLFFLLGGTTCAWGGVFMTGPIQAEPDQCVYARGRMYPNHPQINHYRGPWGQKKHIFDAASTCRLVSISGLGAYTGDFQKSAFRAPLGQGNPTGYL